MLREYTPTEIKNWIHHCVSNIEGRTLHVRPIKKGMTLDEAMIDELANLLQFRGDIRTVKLDKAFSAQAKYFMPYLFHTLGTVKLYGNERMPYVQSLDLSQIMVDDELATSFALLAKKTHYKVVTMSKNSLTLNGFNKLVQAVISGELQTQFWVEQYFVDDFTRERSTMMVSDLYNAGQIFTYLFEQNLPYELHRIILERFHNTLQNNDWLKYIESNSRIDILLPPGKNQEALMKMINWCQAFQPKVFGDLSKEEIRQEILENPNLYLQIKDMKQEETRLRDDHPVFKEFNFAFNPHELMMQRPKQVNRSKAPIRAVTSDTAKVVQFSDYQKEE